MAKDAYHDIVKRALEKNGWRITHDPLVLEFEDLRVLADLSAEQIYASEDNKDKIAVEIKVLGGMSKISEFEKALGQYHLYRTLIQQLKLERSLFLAISKEIYRKFFQRPSIRVIVRVQEVKILVFDPDTETIIEWIE